MYNWHTENKFNNNYNLNLFLPEKLFWNLVSTSKERHILNGLCSSTIMHFSHPSQVLSDDVGIIHQNACFHFHVPCSQVLPAAENNKWEWCGGWWRDSSWWHVNQREVSNFYVVGITPVRFLLAYNKPSAHVSCVIRSTDQFSSNTFFRFCSVELTR